MQGKEKKRYEKQEQEGIETERKKKKKETEMVKELVGKLRKRKEKNKI